MFKGRFAVEFRRKCRAFPHLPFHAETRIGSQRGKLEELSHKIKSISGLLSYGCSLKQDCRVFEPEDYIDCSQLIGDDDTPC